MRVITYAMHPRNMLYDSINYVEQISTIIRNHRLKKEKAASDDEYLSGFTKQDKITPVITIVVYFGSKKWDAPTSLHEMFDVKDRSYLRFVPDYKITLITPEGLSEEELDKFHTEFRKVMNLSSIPQIRML